MENPFVYVWPHLLQQAAEASFELGFTLTVVRTGLPKLECTLTPFEVLAQNNMLLQNTLNLGYKLAIIEYQNPIIDKR